MKRIEEQKQKIKENTLMESQNYQLDKDDELFKKQQEIERKIKSNWLQEKREYEKLEEDNKHDYQSILKQIKDSKNKVRGL